MGEEKKIVSLWAVGWDRDYASGKDTPHLYRGEAVEGPKGYTATGDTIAVEPGYDARSAFDYRARITKSEREGMLVGLTPKEAIDLAFAQQVARKADAVKALNEAEAKMTLLLKLELAVEKEGR